MRMSKGLLTVVALMVLAITVAASGVAFTPLKSLVLSVPLRFDYVPSGVGTKPILTSDLDGAFIQSVSQSGQTVTFNFQAPDNQPRTLQFDLAEADGVLTGATYAADTETLTLTLSQGGPVEADLSGLTTTAEVATAISTALAAETDAVLTGASYTADTETLTLALSQGGPVNADLSDLTTAAELSTAITTAIAGVTDATITGATYAADTETLTLTLSQGGPVEADLSGLTTTAEVATAISTAVATATGVPQLLGTHRRQGDSCRTFRPTSTIIPADGWILAVFTASNNSGHYVTQHSLPVSALHQLPVKIDDAATSATLRHVIDNRNALTFNTRRASSGSGQAYLGLTTANRLVVGHSWRYFPCQVDIYTRP